jgi:hypothetical protein
MSFETDVVILSGPIIENNQAITKEWFLKNNPYKEIKKELDELRKLIIDKKEECVITFIAPEVKNKNYSIASDKVYPKEIAVPWVAPIKTIKKKLIKYPNLNAHFTILGIPTQWQIINYKVVDKNGEDLYKSLPIYFNLDTEIYKLESIFGYYVRRDVSPGARYESRLVLNYSTINKKTGVRNTFDSGPGVWDKYSR